MPAFPKKVHRTTAYRTAALLIAAALPESSSGKDRNIDLWQAGAYSFSNELGGFRILSVAGSGTREDPVVITQELESASPVTLTIRIVGPISAFGLGAPGTANGFLHMRVIARNNSGHPWQEFEFELQERLGEASVFGDGLSFDQRRSDSANIGSDSFSRFSRDFEPYDRLLYLDGKVDPSESVSFGFLVTDFTPRFQFYLVQDPRIPSS